MGITPAREEAEQAFLDAAERLLVSVGYANITTRKLAEEAGLNHGLVHYYFGSMQELLVQVLERFTDRLVKRQRAMYSANIPFIEKWRAAMNFMDEDFASGYPKVWFELRALGWNEPDIRKRLAKVEQAWTVVLTDAFRQAIDEYGLDEKDFPVDAVVALVVAFNEGMQAQMLGGVRTGHAALLAWIDGWLVQLERDKRKKKRS